MFCIYPFKVYPLYYFRSMLDTGVCYWDIHPFETKAQAGHSYKIIDVTYCLNYTTVTLKRCKNLSLNLVNWRQPR